MQRRFSGNPSPEAGGRHAQMLILAKDFRRINKSLQLKISELEQANTDFLKRLVNVCCYKDNETGNHNQRVGEISSFLASRMGASDADVYLIGIAAPMHDIGKIAIPDAILAKEGKLTQAEYEIIKTHTLIGGDIFKDANSLEMSFARDIALYHHERWDGKGYPHGLMKKAIPFSARVTAVADVLDVLLSWRPYKKPLQADKALKIIRQNKGTQFDPAVVEVLTANFKDVLSIRLCARGSLSGSSAEEVKPLEFKKI